jgi:hypothetical protein
MKDETPLPLTRMISINKPSFWIFLTVCFILYVCAWQHDRLSADELVSLNSMLITGAIFIGLLLNIIAVSVKNRTLVYNIMIVTYFFEVASVIALAFLIYMP